MTTTAAPQSTTLKQDLDKASEAYIDGYIYQMPVDPRHEATLLKALRDSDPELNNRALFIIEHHIRDLKPFEKEIKAFLSDHGHPKRAVRAAGATHQDINLFSQELIDASLSSNSQIAEAAVGAVMLDCINNNVAKTPTNPTAVTIIENGLKHAGSDVNMQALFIIEHNIRDVKPFEKEIKAFLSDLSHPKRAAGAAGATHRDINLFSQELINASLSPNSQIAKAAVEAVSQDCIQASFKGKPTNPMAVAIIENGLKHVGSDVQEAAVTIVESCVRDIKNHSSLVNQLSAMAANAQGVYSTNISGSAQNILTQHNIPPAANVNVAAPANDNAVVTTPAKPAPQAKKQVREGVRLHFYVSANGIERDEEGRHAKLETLFRSNAQSGIPAKVDWSQYRGFEGREITVVMRPEDIANAADIAFSKSPEFTLSERDDGKYDAVLTERPGF